MKNGLFILTLCAACGTDDTEQPILVLDDGADTLVDTGSEAPTCGAADLCGRSIDECGVAMDPATCEGWYDADANCADMDAYTECNCDCVQQDTCDAYFACGELCFADFC